MALCGRFNPPRAGKSPQPKQQPIKKGKKKMYYKNTIDEMIDKLNAHKEHALRAAAAWEKVTIKKTKTGAEFKNLGAAVEGARVEFEQYSLCGARKIVVTFRGARTMYDDDELRINGFIDELPATDPRRANYKRDLIRQMYAFTADEIRTAIKDHIEWLKESAADYNKQIIIAAEAAKKYRDAIKAAETTLVETISTAGIKNADRSSIYYLCTSTR